MQVIRRARGEQGTRYQLSLYTTEQLKMMLAQAFDSADQIVTFVELVQEILIERGEIPSNPDVAS